GGGINIIKANLEIVGTTFNGCQAVPGRGGAISTFDGPATILGSTFTSNHGYDNAGAIYTEDARLTIYSTLFDQNSTEGNRIGGAIYHLGSLEAVNPLILTDCIFSNNTAGEGGAIGCIGGFVEPFKFENCSFLSNIAVDEGGALWFVAVYPGLTVKNCTFDSNLVTGGWAGAASFASVGTLRFEQTTFSNNEAGDGSGGGIVVDFADKLVINQCNFNGNIAHTVHPAGSFGGGAYVDGGEIIISSSTFTGNKADEGAALYDASGEAKINYCDFEGNTDPNGQPVPVVSGGSELADYSNNCWNGQMLSEDAPYQPPTPGCPGPTLVAAEQPEPAKVVEAPQHDGTPSCPITHAGNDDVATGNPISLKEGEKRQHEVDIVLNTSRGALILSRAYRQNKQNAYDFVGAGWKHNHLLSLTHVGNTIT
ncbi:MAG: right-handed parallel beta-helix repeat-containing protein, partial [Anaerolineae bacterium]|nr:right-handed parallel beta-helix repeat-containing protein [Anaerolineae bacterium]